LHLRTNLSVQCNMSIWDSKMTNFDYNLPSKIFGGGGGRTPPSGGDPPTVPPLPPPLRGSTPLAPRGPPRPPPHPPCRGVGPLPLGGELHLLLPVNPNAGGKAPLPPHPNPCLRRGPVPGHPSGDTGTPHCITL